MSENKSAAEKSLFERIGGDAAVRSLIDVFYGKVLNDPELSSFFDDASMERLRKMQYEFFATALGGPTKYSGRPLREVHHGRGIRPKHLKRFLDHLLATLQETKGPLSEQEIYDVVSRINLYADQVTETTSVDG